MDLLTSVVLRRTKTNHLGWGTTQKQEWGLFLLQHLLHNVGTMQRKEHQRCSCGPQFDMADAAPEHPSMWTLLGSPDAAILKIAENVYRGEWTLAPSILPHRQQDYCIRILHQQLAKHHLQEDRGVLMAVPLHGYDPPPPDLGEQIWPRD